MKILSKSLILFGIVTLGFTACSENEQLADDSQSKVPVLLTTRLTAMDADATRAGVSLNESMLEKGNVGVWLSSVGYGTKYTYTAASGGALSSESPAYYPISGTTDIVAVYPASAITADASQAATFAVLADQTVDANYEASDLMRGIKEGLSKTSGVQSIPLTHKMAKVIVKITPGAGVSSITSVTLNNIKRQITYTASTDVLGQAVQILGTDVSVGTNNCAAVIPPQTIAAGTDFLTIVTDAGTAVYRFKTAKELLTGNYYQLNITVNRTATLGANTIEAWDGSGSVNVAATTKEGGLTIADDIPAQTYTGNPILPEITAVKRTDEDDVLDASLYDICYLNNINAGTATVFVIGKGTEAGKVGKKEFTINKATRPAPTFSPTSVNCFLNGMITADVTATFIDDGQTSNAAFTSANTDVATVAAKSATTGVVTYTVTGVSVGSTTLNFTIPEGDNYLAYSGSAVVAVNVNAHEFVDLGLSVLWATMNVGAFSVTDYGNYYCWGGTTDVTSTSINVGWNSNCPYWSSGDGLSAKFTKYVPTAKTDNWGGSGSPDNKLVLELSDDAASVNWAGDWRMPTEVEFQELIDNCTWTWNSNYNSSGVAGYVVSGNGNSIFLPAAGERYSTSFYFQGSRGTYWSSSLFTNSPCSGLILYFNSNGRSVNSDYGRSGGFSVRAVLSK